MKEWPPPHGPGWTLTSHAHSGLTQAAKVNVLAAVGTAGEGTCGVQWVLQGKVRAVYSGYCRACSVQ